MSAYYAHTNPYYGGMGRATTPDRRHIADRNAATYENLATVAIVTAGEVGKAAVSGGGSAAAGGASAAFGVLGGLFGPKEAAPTSQVSVSQPAVPPALIYGVAGLLGALVLVKLTRKP